jgi:hypothetical protein
MDASQDLIRFFPVLMVLFQQLFILSPFHNRIKTSLRPSIVYPVQGIGLLVLWKGSSVCYGYNQNVREVGLLGEKELLHSRRIEVSCFETDEESLLVEGWLTDERMVPCMLYTTGQLLDPGVFHHMIARMRVSLPDLYILSLDAEMPIVPMDMCREISDSVEKLIGLQLKPGFTDTVRSLLGYTEGCVHLMNLVLAMASAAVQGAGTFYSRKREDDRPGQAHVRPEDLDRSVLVNSCWLWREDGPLMNLIRMSQADRGVTEK